MSGGIYKFSDILKISNMHTEQMRGCIVDTSILFAYGYPNDNFNKAASELFDYISDLKLPVFTNANIRAEFINNYFQVVVPESLNDLYQYPGIEIEHELKSKLASNYANLYDARRTGKSYKFNTTKIEEWKKLLRKYNKSNKDGWFAFCSSFVSNYLDGAWENTCEEAGVYFLSLRGSDSKEWMTSPIEWSEMVKIVGNFGIGSFDAMIVNLVMNSHFDGIFTADIEMAKNILKISNGNKFVFVPDQLTI